MSRCFIALRPNIELATQLTPLLEPLRLTLQAPNYLWYPQQNWHMTLHFIGEVDTNSRSRLWKKTKHALKQQPRLHYIMNAIEWFPNTSHPKVIALTGPSHPELNSLTDILKSALSEEGYPGERQPFRMHITLARIQAHHSALPAVEWPQIETRLEAKEVVLLESEQTSTGPIYKAVGKIQLK